MVSTGMNALIKIIKTSLAVFVIGIFGALFLLTESGKYFEQESGLDWLFRIKGPSSPPGDVVIVSIDRESAEKLKFSDDPENWPRSYYAKLIRKINQQNPAVIAFNLHFSESRDATEDQMLAKAMASKKNVILSNYLKQDIVPDQSPIGEIRYEPVIEPTPLLNHTALVTAPFPLPKTSSTVKEFWKYSSGGLATFPVCIFQYFVLQEAYPEILQILGKIDPAAFSIMPSAFDEFKRQNTTVESLEDIQAAFTKDETSLNVTEQAIANLPNIRKKQLLNAWLALLEAKEKLYLNHYGDTGTIATVPFYKVLSSEGLEPDFFKNKIVLVGYSDDIEPEKYQGFYTTFSKASGKVISPIELAATAVANIIDQSWLKPLPMDDAALLALLWGGALSGIFRLLSYKYSILLVLVLAVAYGSYCSFLFVSEQIWLPLFIPMLQAFVVISWQTAIYLLRLRTVSGTHLPQKVIDEITRKGKIDAAGISVLGVCMATDIDKYTSLSEELGARQIAKLINDYNAVIYPKISANNGIVLNNIGDAILAGWVSEKIDVKLRRDACHAALEIKAAIDCFNNTSKYPLMTRIGLHYGEMDMGFVGANGRYEYRAVGDTVNTSTRIEGLNKILGTRILVSGPVFQGLPEFFCRELGFFLLRGRSQPVAIGELLGKTKEIQRAQPHLEELIDLFSKAFELFRNGHWQQALEAFREIAETYPEDGPTRFYVNYLQNRLSLSNEQSNSKKYSLIIDVGNITA